MKISTDSLVVAPLLLLGSAAAAVAASPLSPLYPDYLSPQFKIACPRMHILGARETLAGPGFGSSQTLVDLVTQRFPGTTAEPIDYPAAGGETGNYTQSVSNGVIAVLAQLAMFDIQCPNTIILMHGYSQGAQIMDDAFCGGPDGQSVPVDVRSLVPDKIGRKVAAIIMMGNPRHVDGLSYNVGNATAPGFAARPANFTCPEYENRMQLYCDSPDPFCANGTDAEFHQGYGKRNGQQALQFIEDRLSAAGINI